MPAIFFTATIVEHTGSASGRRRDMLAVLRAIIGHGRLPIFFPFR